MNSSKPGAEKTATARMASFPILSTEIHVLAGINTVEPPWTTLAVSPKCTRAVPLSKNRISSAPGCLWGSMAPPLRMSAVIKTKCDEPPFLGSTFRMKVSPGSGCPGQPLTTRRSPSSFSRMSGVVWGRWAACGDEANGVEVFTHTKIAQTAILGRTIRMRWFPQWLRGKLNAGDAPVQVGETSLLRLPNPTGVLSATVALSLINREAK
jgi:hypothetical protein